MPTFTTRVNFNNTNRGTNGGHRVGGPFADAAGDFSGTTAPGGANNDGTVFDIPSGDDGSDVGTSASFDGASGAYPEAGLIAAAGDLSANGWMPIRWRPRQRRPKPSRRPKAARKKIPR